MRKMRILALLLLVALVALVGCGGGGGSGSESALTSADKDVAGITSTLDKFAAALKSGDVSSTGLFAQTSTDQTAKILYVKDFGADMSNPSDNQTWEFSVLPENITQTSLDKAIVKASKVMSTGRTLWLVFAMLREQGVWYIEGITVEETGTGGAFTVSRYYPVVPGSSMKYLESGTPPTYYTDGFSATDWVEKNGIKMYRTTSSDEAYPMGTSIRAQRAQLFDSTGFYVGYNSSGELWAYSSLVNGGQPYRILKTAYALGQKEVVTETTSNGTFVTTLTIGAQTKSMPTPLRTFSTIPVTEEVSFLINGTPATETSIIYFADGIGIVAIEDYGYNLTTPDSTDLLFERYVDGLYDRNLPTVSPQASSQNVVVGQAMVPVQFSAANGTGPMTWTVANAPVGVTIDSATGRMAGTPDPTAPLMTWNTIVTATDIYGRQGTSQYNIAVVTAPALTVTAPTNSQQVVIGQKMTDVQFTAANGTAPLTWTLGTGAPAGVTLSTAGLLSGTVDPSTDLGNYSVTISAKDAIGGTGSMVFTISVINPPALAVTAPTSSQQVVIGQKMTDVQFTAANGTAPLTWTLGTGAPVGVTLSTAGLLSGTVDPSTALGNYSVTISAKDAIGGTGSMVFTISVINPPALAVTAPTSSQQVVIGQAMTEVQFTAANGTAPLTWTLGTGAPAGVTLDSSTGRMYGTIDPATALGDHPVTVTAQDKIGGTGSMVFTFSVKSPITITPANGNQTIYVGGTIQQVAFTAAGGSGTGFTWSVTGNPVNIGIGGSGLLSGTVVKSTAPRPYDLIITATDSLGNTGSTNYTLTVTPPPPLSITSSDGASMQQVVIGQSMTAVTFSATGNIGAVNWSCSGQPSNIGIGSTGILSGPVVLSTVAKDYVVTVTAVDSQTGGTGSMQYTLRVVPGTYYMPSYYPTVPGNEYIYAVLPDMSEFTGNPSPDLLPVPDRMLITTLSDNLALQVTGGETVTFYKDYTAPIVAPSPNVRAGIRKNLRGSTRSTLRGATTPELAYYRGFDAVGNIWEYCPAINGGAPYMLYPAWMNPGDTFQFTQNYNYYDSDLGAQQTYSAVTSITVGDALVNGMETPLSTYNNLLKATWKTSIDTVPQGAKEFYFAENIGVVAYYQYPDQTLTAPNYKELIMTTKLSGTVTDNPVQINTPAILPYTAVVDISLNASGGDSAKGYVWSLVSGTMPPNLTLQSNGKLAGTSLGTGSFAFILKVEDYYFRSATREFTMTVP